MIRFEAVYNKTSNNPAIGQSYILLENVIDTDTNVEFRDHVWIKLTKRFEKLNLKKGDKVFFTARIEEYLSTTSYKLGLRHIRNLQKDVQNVNENII